VLGAFIRVFWLQLFLRCWWETVFIWCNLFVPFCVRELAWDKDSSSDKNACLIAFRMLGWLQLRW
jgi:hypothetical protein